MDDDFKRVDDGFKRVGDGFKRVDRWMYLLIGAVSSFGNKKVADEYPVLLSLS